MQSLYQESTVLIYGDVQATDVFDIRVTQICLCCNLMVVL